MHCWGEPGRIWAGRSEYLSVDVAIIGGGLAGLTAARTLSRRGLRCALFEAGDRLGGLASCFRFGTHDIERYYHFASLDDTELLSLLDGLGVSNELVWREVSVSALVDGALHPFTTPFDLLRFRPIRPVNRLRTGLGYLYLTHFAREADLSRQTAVRWLTDLLGEDAYHAIWEPLLTKKFGSHAERISASWVWARIRRFGRHRPMTGRQRAGYFRRSIQPVLDRLEQELRADGCAVHLDSPVDQIVVENGELRGLRSRGQFLACSKVLSTVASPRFLAMTPGLPEAYREKLGRIENIGVVCLLLRMNRRLSRDFWTNINDPQIPFPGVIEFTNLRSPEDSGGCHWVYLPCYVDHREPHYRLSDEALLQHMERVARQINPAFRRDWIEGHQVFRDTYAQPICDTSYRDNIPSFETAVSGLYITDSSQLHPDDRTLSNSVGLGRKVSELILRS